MVAYIKIISFVLLGYAAVPSFAETLTLNFEGFRSGEGFAAVSVFDEAAKKAFPDQADQAVRKFYVELKGETSLKIQVEDLPRGSYAVSMMHDEDGDQQFETSFIGFPQEGFGFSRDPRLYFGPPAFNRAKILFEKDQTLTVKVRYL